MRPLIYLIQDEPLLRLPHELLRKNFKTAQRLLERERESIISTLKSTANAALGGAQTVDTVASMDIMLLRLETLKRKLTALHEEENAIHDRTTKRIAYLGDLYQMDSLIDVKYEEWSKVRLDRLLVDFMGRSGYVEAAGMLANERNIDNLVDVEVFTVMGRIEAALKAGDVREALSWCLENKQVLKKQKASPRYPYACANVQEA
jgi:macrophage erythroblast attacher